MAYNGSDAVNQSVEIAQAAMNAFTNVKLYNFEVGNEPDLYITNQYRPSSWTAADSGNEWIARVQAVWNAVLKPKGISQAFFEAACTATTAANPSFRISNLVQTGVATDNGVWLSGWNQHDYYYYVNVSKYQLTLEKLMDIQSTAGQFKEWNQQIDQAQVTGKPYYLREMGAVGPAGIKGITDTFGGALWTLNFFLYAATVGVDSVQLHCLQDSYTSPWQPMPDENGNGPYIRPSYYAFAAMAQINGAGCQTQVGTLSLNNLPSGYSRNVAGYGIYNAGTIQSIVIMNNMPAYSGNSIPTQQVTLTIPQLAGKTFYLSNLTASGADATSDVTWNGISYEKSGSGQPTVVSRTKQAVQVASDGTFTIPVRDSSAVVANLGSVLGTMNNVVDQKACTKQAATVPAKTKPSGFKSTSGFASFMKLPKAAIIGIAAGGGALILAILGLSIWCCVRCCRRRRQRKVLSEKMAGGYGAAGAAGLSRRPAGGSISAGKAGAGLAGYYKSVGNDGSETPDDMSLLPMRGKEGSFGDMSSRPSSSGTGAGGPYGSRPFYNNSNPSLAGTPLLNAQSPRWPESPSMQSFNQHLSPADHYHGFDQGAAPQWAGVGAGAAAGAAAAGAMGRHGRSQLSDDGSNAAAAARGRRNSWQDARQPGSRGQSRDAHRVPKAASSQGHGYRTPSQDMRNAPPVPPMPQGYHSRSGSSQGGHQQQYQQQQHRMDPRSPQRGGFQQQQRQPSSAPAQTNGFSDAALYRQVTAATGGGASGMTTSELQRQAAAQRQPAGASRESRQYAMPSSLSYLQDNAYDGYSADSRYQQQQPQQQGQQQYDPLGMQYYSDNRFDGGEYSRQYHR